jgi:hypothetical protein
MAYAARGRHLDAKRQRGAPDIEVAGEHVRTARVVDHAGQLGLVDAAMLLDVEQRFAEQLVAIVSAHAGTSGTAAAGIGLLADGVSPGSLAGVGSDEVAGTARAQFSPDRRL